MKKLLKKGDYNLYLLKVVIILLFIIPSFAASAQLVGWPNNSGALSPEEEPDASTITSILTCSTTYKTDANRARVTSSTLISTSPDVYDLAVTLVSGATFTAGRWCLIMQMEDNTTSYKVGQHCGVKVINYSSGVLRVELLSGNTYPTFNFSTSGTDVTRIQIIQIPIWRTINLEPKGEITCEPYDHATGTGGVVAIIAGDILNLKGGIVNASAKGYHIGGTYTLGTGGAGQNAALTHIGTGGFPFGPLPYAHNSVVNGNPPPLGMNPANNGYMCSSNLAADAILDFDNTGHLLDATFGGDANNSVLAGSSTSSGVELYYPSSPLNSGTWTVLMMGSSGSPGSNGGSGAGGGGWGGQGETNANGLGILGTSGYNGFAGGNAGDGSRGGGIILFKINNFSRLSTISSTHKLFFADGENGKYGTNGGNGGDGGDGGLGGDGGCAGIKLISPGSIGGYGESGIGAMGGDGGEGGECGAVWLLKRTTGALSGHVSLRGGLGGSGGAGGYSKDYNGLPLANNWLPPGLAALPCNTKSYTMCYPTYSCPTYEVCDCDKVFEQLSDINTGYTVSNTTMPYHIDKTGYQSVWYDDNFLENGNAYKALYYDDLSGGCPVRYKCIMYRQELYQKMLEKLYKTRDLQTFVPLSGSTYNVGTNTIFTNSGTGYIELNYVDAASTTWKVLEYRPLNDDLEDMDDPSRPIVHAWNCEFTYPEIAYAGGGSGGGGSPEDPVKKPEFKLIKTGSTGSTGGDKTNQTPTGSGNTDHFGEDDNAPFIGRKPLNETIDLATIRNQLIGNNVVVEVELITKDKVANYMLYDMSGKLVEKGIIEEKIQFTGFTKGIYTLIIKTQESQDIKKLTF